MGSVLSTAVGVFRSLPPELQNLAIAGLAVNKLTGGLVTNIAGGLISGVLKRLVSGVVNVQGAVVNVAGAGLPAAGLPAAAAGAGTLGLGAALGIATVSAGAAAVIGVAVADAMVGAENRRFANKGLNAEEVAAMRYYTASAADQSTIAKRIGRIPSRADWLSAIAKLNTPDKPHGGLSPDERDEKQRAAIQATTDAIQRAKDSQDAHLSAATQAIKDAKAATDDKVPRTTRAVEVMKARLAAETARNTGATVSQSGFTRNTIRSGTGQIVGAISRIPAPIVNVNVTATHVTKSVTYQNRYGPGGGSGAKDHTGAVGVGEF
jgi:hypothetical protein